MEWIVLASIFLLVILMACGMVVENRQRKAMTEDEWERRERGVSLLGAGAMGLHKILHADLEKAVAMQQDARQGMLPSAEHENNKAEKKER